MAKTYNVDILFNIFNKDKGAITDVQNSVNRLLSSAQQGSVQFAQLNAIINKLNRPLSGTSSLLTLGRLLNDISTGITDVNNSPLIVNAEASERRLKFIVQNLKSALGVAERLGDIDLFKDLSRTVAQVESISSEFSKQVKTNKEITQEISKQRAILDAQASAASKSISAIQSKFEKLKTVGGVSPQKGELTRELTDALTVLEDVRKKKTELGKDPTSVNVTIEKGKSVLDQINKIDDLAEDIAKKQYELKVVAANSIKDINKDLINLKKLLREAQESKDLKLVAKLRLDTKEVESKLQGLQQYAGQEGDTKLSGDILKSSTTLAKFKKELNETDRSIPKGVLGYFSRLGNAVSDTKKALNQNNSGIRATAGALRLVGTSAFLVGGQFRTLGFGASAAGNILQTFAPLLGTIVAKAGPLAPVLLTVAAALGVVVAQAGAFTVALVSIIDTGFKFNNQFSRVQNSVAAVAREFFDFSSATKPASAGMTDAAAAAQQFEVAGAAVSKELIALQFEATKTEFTAQDLFNAFQSTTSALGNLSPSLTASRKLTGLFARTASIARVPIEQLGSSISQIVAGTGRVTNPLVRDVFNKLKDSQGIALTAKRIRELRAQGGTVLFDELTKALERFTAGVGELQSESTFSGAFSNIQDLFQVFSGQATKGAYDVIVAGLVKVRNAISETDKVTKETNLTPPFQKLLDVATAFITVIGNDVASIFEKITGYFSGLGGYLDENYQQFISIYELSKDILKVVGDIVVDFLEFVGLTGSGSAGLKVIQFIMSVIIGFATAFRVTWNGIALIILTATRIVVGFGQAIGKLVSFLSTSGTSALEDWANSTADSLEKNIAERAASIVDSVTDFTESVKKVTQTDRFKRAPKAADTGIADAVSTPRGTGKTDSEDARASARSNLRLLEQYKQFYSQLLDLNQNTNDLLLDQVQKRIQREQDLINNQIGLGLRGQIAAQEQITKLRLQGIEAEIAAKKASATIGSKRELEAINAAKREQAALAGSSKSKQESADSSNRVEEIGINLATDKLKYKESELKITEELKDLEYQKLQIELEGIQARTKVLLDLQKESADLSAAVAEIKYPNSFAALTEKFKLDVLNITENYFRINSEIAELTNSTKTLSKEESQRLENLKQIRGLILTQIALRQQQATFDQLQLTAGRELDALAKEQVLIQRDIDFGRIGSEAGQRRIIKLNYEYSKALQIVLEQLKKVSAENPTVDQQRQIFDLEQKLKDLSEPLTESTLISASNNIRASLVDTFVSIQENAGGAVDAIKSFASSVLATFRRLLAEKIVKDLFKTLFPEPGQTSGKATGTIAKILRVFGFDPATSAQKEVDNAPVNQELVKKYEDEIKQALVFKTSDERIKSVQDSLESSSKKYADSISPVVDALKKLEGALTTTAALTEGDFKTRFESVLSEFKTTFLNGTKDILESIKIELNNYINKALGIESVGTSSRSGGSSGASGGSSGGRSSRSSGSGSYGGGGRSTGASSGTEKPATQSGSDGASGATGTPAATSSPVSAGNIIPTSEELKSSSADTGYSANFLTNIYNRSKTRTKRAGVIKNIRGNSIALERLLPDSVFSNISDEALTYFNLKDKPNIKSFAEAIEARLVEEYDKYNPLGRNPFNPALLNASGYTKDSTGNLVKTDIPVIRRVYGNDVLSLSNNDPVAAGNLASQIISNINTATNLSRELIGLSSQIEYKEKQLKTQESTAATSQGSDQEFAIKASLSARQAEVSALKESAVSKTNNLQLVTKRLSTLKFDSTPVTDISPSANPFKFPTAARYASGGAVFGKGGPTADSIPAMLSNGEYVVNSKTVKKMGVPFFNKLNNVKTFAEGGSLIDTVYNRSGYTAPKIDTSKFNYFGGAASLIKNPAPIVEEAAKKVVAPKRKKRGIFGNILSAIAPFLNFIPVIGPLLSLGAGAVGGALSGSEKGLAGGILGGIFGGLSNLGGFSGSKGFMGSLSGFFGKGGKGAPFLSLLGMSGAGNLGNTIGQGLFGITNQLLANGATTASGLALKASYSKDSVRDILARGISKNAPSYSKNNITDLLKKLIGGSKPFGFAGGGILNFASMLGGGGLSSIVKRIAGGGISSLLGSVSGGGGFLGGIGSFLPLIMSLFKKKSNALGALGGILPSILGRILPGFAGGGILNFASMLGGGGLSSIVQKIAGGGISSLLGKVSGGGGFLGGIGSFLPLIMSLFKKKSNASGALGGILPSVLGGTPPRLTGGGFWGLSPSLLGGILPGLAGGGFLGGMFSKLFSKDSFAGKLIRSKAGLSLGMGLSSVFLGPLGMLIPLIIKMLASKKSAAAATSTAPSATSQPSGMATGGIVPDGPKSSTLSGGIVSAFKSVTSSAKSPTLSGIFSKVPSIMKAAVGVSKKITDLKMPDLSSLDAKSFNILAQKGGWKIGFGKAVKLAGGGMIGDLPYQDTNYLKDAIKKLAGGGSGSGGKSGDIIAMLLGLAGSFLPGLLNKPAAEPDYSIQDPDAARKNKFGSAYNSLVDYGIIGEYKYQKETLDALRRGSKWRPILKKKSNIGGMLSSLLPMIFGAISGAIGGEPEEKASGGMVRGPGTGTSDSIPAWLSSGEYVIKASAVRNLGTNILDSINDGRYKFANGGLAGPGVSTLPEIDFSATGPSETPVTVNNNTKVVNVLDPALFGDYIKTNDGGKLLLNFISRRSKEIKGIINR